jgi:hypothetical protein
VDRTLGTEASIKSILHICSTSGDIKLWDLRYSRTTQTFKIPNDGEMSAMSVHERAGLIST